MTNESKNFQEQVANLNQHIKELNEFTSQNGLSHDFKPIHFVGNPDSHEGEAALIDHWDEFLQYSQKVLNEDGIAREEALNHIDVINIVYKRVLAKIQTI